MALLGHAHVFTGPGLKREGEEEEEEEAIGRSGIPAVRLVL